MRRFRDAEREFLFALTLDGANRTIAAYGLGRVLYEDTGNIGKGYRRHDEVGTPICITVDFDTLDDNAVTVRDRDTMEQVRVPIDGLVDLLSERLPD